MSQYPTDLFRTSCGATAPLELNVSGPGLAGPERYIFEQPFVLIGRHSHASLHLEDAVVSRRHAYLQQLGGRVFCVDLGSRRGIRWGGESRPAGWLSQDQGIQIGPFTLELAMAAGAEGSPSDEAGQEGDPLQDRVHDSQILPWIFVEGDGKVLAKLRMNRVLVLVGSSPACRLRLREPGVSLYHCSLVRTPEGVWMIDLLNDAGTGLNGQPVRWALLKEGDQFQVGPYVLRVWYENVGTATSPDRSSEIRAEAPVQSADKQIFSLPSPSSEIPPEPAGLLVPTGNVLAQTLAVPQAEQSATEVSSLVPALQAELEQARERLRDAEDFKQQLADSQAECVRLRDQFHALEIQLAEATDLQARLEAAEASAREQEVVSAERDQWQAEAQSLQTRLASEVAEREQWQHRLEAAQQQLIEEREAVRAVEVRLDQESAALQGVRADLQTRSNECSAALQQLQEAEAELDQLREHLRDAETLRQQLADTQAKHDQLCARVPELEDRATSVDSLRDRLQAADAEIEQLRVQLRAAESRVAELEAMSAECDRLRDQTRALESQLAEAVGLQSRLEAAETSARELEAVRAERDQWQGEAQTLQARIASEVAEREQWQQRLEAAQQQLVEERENVHAAEVRLDQESAALQGVRADLETRNAEHNLALQRLQKAQEDLDQARERLRDADMLRQPLADRQAECVRLRDQLHALEIQLAGMAELQAQLQTVEASARELEAASAERDQWQAEARTLQARLASEGAEREQWKHQLEAVQQQLAEERENARAAGVRLDQESAALQRLQETQEELARLQGEARGLQADLDQARERLRDAEAFKQQLADRQAECVRLRDQLHALEIQVADRASLQSRLEAAEASARQLEVVCAERDQLQAEVQTLQNRPASDSSVQEQIDCLAADLRAAREERDRLHIEQETALHSAEQARARVAELERALTEAAAAHQTAVAEARGRWESERQALEARLEQERQAHSGAIQAAVRDIQMRAEAAIREVQARAVAEREEWRQRMEGAEAQIVCERGLFQEQGQQSRRQVATLKTERDRLAARLAEAEQLLRGVEERFRNMASQAVEPAHVRQWSVSDQLFSQLNGIQVGHLLGQIARTQGQDKLAEQARTRVPVEFEQVPAGEQHGLAAIVQGVEPAPSTPPAAQPDTGEASLSSDAPQDASAPVEATPPIEELHGSSPQHADETGPGRWRKILNFVLGK